MKGGEKTLNKKKLLIEIFIVFTVLLCLSAVSAQDLSDYDLSIKDSDSVSFSAQDSSISESAADDNYQLENEGDFNNCSQTYQENDLDDEAVLSFDSNANQILNQSDSEYDVLGDDSPIFNVEIHDPNPSHYNIIIDFGENRYVEGDTFGDIQKCIYSSSNGDKIILTGGKTYFGNGNRIFISKHLTIKSEGGNAILDARNLSSILYVSDTSKVTVENVDFINGISNSDPSSGGAIIWAGPNGQLKNCNFINNTATLNGGAILWGNNDGTIENCNFINNSAEDGGAIIIWGYRNKIRNCIFRDNSAKEQAGAIYLSYNDNEIINCDFRNNSAGWGGAIRSQGNKDKIIDCYFEQNSATYSGAMYLKPYDTDKDSIIEGNYTLSNCVFLNNFASSGYAGAVWCMGNDSSILNCNFTNNSVTGDRGYGGAIFTAAKNVVIGNCTFTNNSASKLGGAITVAYVSDCNLITDSMFIDNFAERGNAIFIDPTNIPTYIIGCSFKNKANSNSLDLNDKNLCLIFNLKASIDYNDLKDGDGYVFDTNQQYFWNGESFIEHGFFNINNLVGNVNGINQTVILEIYNSTDDLIANVTGLTDSLGQINYDYSSLADGRYTYRAYHPDSDDFSFILTEGSFERSHIPTELSITISNVTYPGPAVATIIASSPGTYKLVIAGTEYDNITVTDRDISKGRDRATKTVTVNLLGANDNYEASVTYQTNEIYLGASNQTRFSVYKARTMIDVNETVGYYTEDAEIAYAVVNDTAVNVVSIRNNAGELAEGADYTIISNENGKIILRGLAIGTYVVNLTAGVDDNHYPSSKEFTLIIKPLVDLSIDVVPSNKNPLYGDTINYKITVTNNGPNVATGVIVTYAIGNSVSVSSKDASYMGNGIWNISSIGTGSANAVKLTLYATLKNLGSAINSFNLVSSEHDKNIADNCAGISVNTQIKTVLTCKDMTTTAIDISVDGKKGQYYSLILKDANKKVLAGKIVAITLNKVTYKVKTDSKGVAKLQVNLKKAGTYTAKIKFTGDGKYLGSPASVKIKVNKQKPQLISSKKTFSLGAKTKKITAILKTSKGKILKGKSIVFTVNGKKYTVKTDSKGVATLNAKLTKKGKYTCNIKYAGDATYSPIAKNIAVVIK